MSPEPAAVQGFASLRFPEGMARRSLLDPRYHTEGYLDAFDAETFWYDAVWSRGRLSLFCPPLNNLRPAVRKSRWRVDGRPVTLRRLRRYKRHEILEFSVPVRPAQISVYLEGWRGESAVHAAAPDFLAGRNVIFYANRDNPLRWITDHARFHRHHHGLDAVVVFDNGSALYGPEAVAEALRQAEVQPLVLPAPFKFGPLGKAPYRRTEKYMQSGLYNLTRLRFFGAVRAVMTVDVDELVMPGAISVFDAARAHPLGFVQVRGAWRDPAPGAEGPFDHADHTYRSDPEDRCPPKYCTHPGSLFWGAQWDNHGMERLPFLHARTHRDLWFAHCRGVTTGWKKMSRLTARGNTELDPAMGAALAAAGLSGPRAGAAGA